MNTFTSFDGTRIAYHDEGGGPAVLLLHGFGTDGLTQFGDFGRLRGQLETLRALFRGEKRGRESIHTSDPIHRNRSSREGAHSVHLCFPFPL